MTYDNNGWGIKKALQDVFGSVSTAASVVNTTLKAVDKMALTADKLAETGLGMAEANREAVLSELSYKHTMRMEMIAKAREEAES